MKHAYMILCHSNFDQLKILLSLLDYPDNDIFIHVDKKSRLTRERKLDLIKDLKLSKASFVRSRSISWGSDSMMKAEIELLASAVKNGCTYYHLISGADLPLRSQKDIHEFFDKSGRDYISLELKNGENIGSYYLHRYSRYYFMQNIVGRGKNKLLRLMQSCSLKLQDAVGIDRTAKAGFTYIKGSQWFSITHDTAVMILQAYKDYKKYFSMTFCPDECFVQTIVYNSRRAENVIDDNLRFIEWTDDLSPGDFRPAVFRAKDFEKLISSDKLFARKFDINTDCGIIGMISEKAKN